MGFEAILFGFPPSVAELIVSRAREIRGSPDTAPGTLKARGLDCAMQPRSIPCAFPVANSCARKARVQSSSGVWPPPRTTTCTAFGMKDFTSSPLSGRLAGSLSPDTSGAGTSSLNGSKKPRGRPQA